MENEKKVLYSGMQATNVLTLGNYLGALKNWVKLNEEYDCYFGVMDLHSLTVRQEPAEFRKKAKELYATFVQECKVQYKKKFGKACKIIDVFIGDGARKLS